MYYEPLRKPKFIHYADIERIVGKTLNTGDGETYSQLLVYAGNAKARLNEEMIWGTDVFDEIEALPGFQHEAVAEFLSVTGSLKWALIPKTTTLLAVRKRSE